MENQTKLVRLPIKLGLTVQEILKAKYNSEPRQDSIEKNTVLFNNDNLELITRLEINKPTPGCLDRNRAFTQFKKIRNKKR